MHKQVILSFWSDHKALCALGPTEADCDCSRFVILAGQANWICGSPRESESR
jgi:hypothetical protein